MHRFVSFIYFFAVAFIIVGIFTSFKPAIRYRATSNPTDSLPPRSEKELFHISRSNNNNFIVYELNFDKDSILNKTEPVHIYWIRNTEGGAIVELSYIQRKYAYGLHQYPLKGENEYKLNFVSYEKIDLFLSKSPRDNKYHVYIHLGKRKVILNRVFVKLEGGTFWFPHIPYIEIQGKDEITGDSVKKRFKP